jgi:hypothetical protein
MIERVHKHIIAELQQNSRTDTIFIITAILLNLLALAINSVIAGIGTTITETIVMILFTILIIVVNFVVIIGLQRGKQTRQKLTQGILKMYRDQGVDGYYDESLLGNYDMRYNLFMMVVVVTGIIAIVVPYVVR